MKLDPSSLGSSLLLMFKGMLGVFLVICVIYALVAILNRVTGKKKSQ